jgi:CubicO group peptidase (beta-lactamase class C family)
MVTMTARIDAKLQAAVAAGAVPGVVAMAAGPDGVLYEGAAGKRSAAADDPITPDTMMRIASMTKMVTTTAALQLLEQGSLRLDAPVKEYRPEFADLPGAHRVRRRHPAASCAGRAGHGTAAHHAHRRVRVLVLER